MCPTDTTEMERFTARWRVNDRTRRGENERGAILVLTALVMLIMLMIAAFATDVGSWYRQGQEQQRSADLGSLNGIQAYEQTRRAEFALIGAQSWADIASQNDREAIDHLALEAAVNAVIDVLEAAGHPVTQVAPNGNPQYQHPTGSDPWPTPAPSSSVTITTDDGLTIVVTRTPELTISVSVKQPGTQYFSSMVSDAPEIERTSVATLSNCGAICNVPFTVNPPFIGFSGAGNGDGFKPLIYEAADEIWTVNHHRNNNTSDPKHLAAEIVCMDQTTRDFCDDNGDGTVSATEGKYSLGNYETHNRPAEEYLHPLTGRLYFVARDFVQEETGLVCFNTNTKNFCGFRNLWNQTDDSSWPAIVNATGPWVYNNRMYVMGQNGELECVRFDMGGCGSDATAGENSGLLPPIDVAGGTDRTTFINGERVGSRILFTHILNGTNDAGGVLVHCWDLAADNECGWAAPVHLPTLTGKDDTRVTFLSYNTFGAVNGICVADIDLQTNRCVPPTGGAPFQIANLSAHLAQLRVNYPAGGLWSGDTYAWQGKRTFFGGGSSNITACWSWEPPVGQCGQINHTVATYPYAFSEINSKCIIGLGDASEYFSFKPSDLSPCVDTTVDVDLTPCDCANSSDQTWGLLVLPESLLDDVTKLTGTILDGGPSAPPYSATLTDVDLLANGGEVDLSGIDPGLHPQLTLHLEVEAKLDPSGIPTWTQPIQEELQLVVQPTLTD